MFFTRSNEPQKEHDLGEIQRLLAQFEHPLKLEYPIYHGMQGPNFRIMHPEKSMTRDFSRFLNSLCFLYHSSNQSSLAALSETTAMGELHQAVTSKSAVKDQIEQLIKEKKSSIMESTFSNKQMILSELDTLSATLEHQYAEFNKTIGDKRSDILLMKTTYGNSVRPY